MSRKIKVLNSLPHLLSAVLTHRDCPEWLNTKIWNALNDNADIPAESPEQLAIMLQFSRVPSGVESVGNEKITALNSEVVQ